MRGFATGPDAGGWAIARLIKIQSHRPRPRIAGSIHMSLVKQKTTKTKKCSSISISISPSRPERALLQETRALLRGDEGLFTVTGRSHETSGAKEAN